MRKQLVIFVITALNTLLSATLVTAQSNITSPLVTFERRSQLSLPSLDKTFSLDVLLSTLETQLRKGNRRALRDVGTLLDKPQYYDAARLLLVTHTFFTDKELNINQITRESFLKFYFTYEDKLKYSDALEAFYLTPVELQTTPFDVKIKPHSIDDDPSVVMRKWILEFDRAYRARADRDTLQYIIEKIATLQTRESYQWLRNTLRSAPFNSKDIELYLTICEALKNEANEENLKAILEAHQKGLVPVEFLSPILLELTNYATTIEQTQQLLDSLESFEALRSYGFDRSLPFKEAFYFEKVDYYGRILCRKDTPWVQRNALRDLLMTESSRLLFYLAVQIRLKPEMRLFYTQLIQKLTKTDFSLAITEGGDENATSRQIKLIENVKAFIRYWAFNADNFEWDKEQQIFVNKNEISERTEQLEKNFRRLNSENDSVALSSYITLTQAEPAIIEEMMERYRPLLRSYNRRLPDIKYTFLEQMTHLTYYCRRNRVALELSRALDSTVHLLLDNRLTPKNRFSIENTLIKQVTIQQLTALEYMGCLYSSNADFAFSISRIADYVYSREWQALIENDEMLRLYLKKSVLFKKIGTVGVCGNYANKFDKVDDYLVARLKDIARIEDDPDIASQIQFIVTTAASKSKEPTNSLLSLFFENPLSFEGTDLKILPAPQAADFQRVLSKMQSESDKKILNLMLDYLDVFANLDAVPILFKLIQDKRKLYEPIEDVSEETAVPTVGQRIVTILENIYGHQFKDDNPQQTWKQLWQKDVANYKEWDKRFFAEQVKFLKNAHRLTIEDILEVSLSKYVTDKHKSVIINALQKLEPFSDIKRFRSKLTFRAESDLKEFNSFPIGAKDLDDFIKIFEVEKDTTMWAFINLQTNEYKIEDLGLFYNALFKVNWFINQVQNDRISTYQKDLSILILNEYLSNSEFLSEFEEQTTLLNIAELQNVGLPPAAKLEATLRLDISSEAKATIQEAVLARISYADIGKIAPLLPDLNKKPGYQVMSFLYRDFGLPIFSNDSKTIENLVQNHQSLTPFEFYKYYLTKFGVDFLQENEELDYNKIYNILKFEIVAPYTGGGVHRDYFTYGIIKLLEFKFNTRLGFHEKLNENQTFYTYSAAKRAAKWMEYLISHRLVTPNPKSPASFNRLIAEN